jgi:hypothetical protein
MTLLLQPRYGLHVRSLREKVEKPEVPKAIGAGQELGEVARQGHGIARDVHEHPRGRGAQVLAHRTRKPGAGRIHDHCFDGGAGGSGGNPLFDGEGVNLIRDARHVSPGVGRAAGVAFHGDDLLEAIRKMRGEHPHPAVEVSRDTGPCPLVCPVAPGHSRDGEGKELLQGGQIALEETSHGKKDPLRVHRHFQVLLIAGTLKCQPLAFPEDRESRGPRGRRIVKEAVHGGDGDGTAFNGDHAVASKAHEPEAPFFIPVDLRPVPVAQGRARLDLELSRLDAAHAPQSLGNDGLLQ